eukprot:NODE_35_length_31537_cov_0.293403.p21 type:complete len:116 gc:universal NODE_35_length_31537_cov_0.293403:19492-19145(-)
MNRLKFQRLDPYDLSYIYGKVTTNANNDVILDAELIKDTDHLYPNMFLSKDFRLSDFRQCLEDIGLRSTFIKGCLVIEDKIMVQKSKDGSLQIEGVLSREYFMVRKMLYMQHALI